MTLESSCRFQCDPNSVLKATMICVSEIILKECSKVITRVTATSVPVNYETLALVIQKLHFTMQAHKPGGAIKW